MFGTSVFTIVYQKGFVKQIPYQGPLRGSVVKANFKLKFVVICFFPRTEMIQKNRKPVSANQFRVIRLKEFELLLGLTQVA